MTATVTELAARALRKLGVAIVADATRMPSGATVTADDIARRAVRMLGINPAGTLGDASLDPPLTTTTNVIASDALVKLGVVAADESPAPLDWAYAQARARHVHDMLSKEWAAPWQESAIPIAVAEWYIIMTANMIAPSFGKPANADAFEMASQAVRRFCLAGQPGQDMAMDKVRAVHEELNALGVVSWPLSAVPGSIAEPYVQMAAALLTPVFKPGTPVDLDSYKAGMGRVRMIAMGGPAGQALAEQKVRAVHYNLDARGLTRWSILDIPDFAEEPYVLMAATLMAPEFGAKPDPTWQLIAERDIMRIISLPSNGHPVQTVYF